MNVGSPVESLAAAIYQTVASAEILPDIVRSWRGDERKQRPDVSDLNIFHFRQLWGSTALGFGGMGGAAMTNAYTTVIICDKNAAVFFAGRHAYSVDDINEAFMEDVNRRCMRSQKEAADKY